MTDQQFLQAFEDCTLEPFPHAHHIRAAWLYLERHPLLEAIAQFTASLKRYAASKGAHNLYHETITWAFLFLINERRASTPHITTWPDFRDHNADLFTWKPGVLDNYYDPATLATPLAKATFILPRPTSAAARG